MEILQINREDKNNFSVQISDDDIILWMDVWKICENDDFECDWNKYIFQLDNQNDMKIQAYQENCNNFETCSNLTIEAVENFLLNGRL
mgnify:CR=1 FL=1